MARFRLLGDLEVESAGRVTRIRGRRVRALFAFLLIHRNQPVSPDRLVDALWGSRPPSSGKHGLQEIVSRLRRMLGPEVGSRVATTSGGYMLRVEAHELDADRFERLFAMARRTLGDGDVEAALVYLREALAEWRGQAFGEQVYEPFLVEEAARLEELRLAALEAMYDAELRVGRHDEAVSELEGFVLANPLREHARAMLMRALYRGGRQADALDTFRDGYRVLAAHGIEPSEELRHVQASILHHDPQLLGSDRETADRPVTRYVKNRDVSIAYQVSGDGPYDVVYAPPFVTNVELTWRVPKWAELLESLGSFSRLVRFDKRGTGMSDRVEVGSLETEVEDVRAVMDATLCTEAAIIGASEAGPLAILLAATYPERVWALVLWGTTARVAWSEDYRIGLPQAELERDLAETERIWTEPGYAEARARAMGAADVSELASLWRQSATPGAIRALDQRFFDVDVRDALPRVRVPTLVLNREGDNGSTAWSNYLAEHIVDARHVAFPGADHVMFAAGDFRPILREIKAFLDQAWERHSSGTREHRSRLAEPRRV